MQTGADLLTDKQQVRWQPYSPPTPTPRWKPPRPHRGRLPDPDRKTGRTLMAALITTLKHRRSQTLAGSHHPRADIDETSHRRAGLLRPPATSNGPTEVINGRLGRLRGSSLGFRNLPTTSPDHYWKPADSNPTTPPFMNSPIS
ncbi:putative transposase [Mycobacterium xenopi 4042]|uniref:Putative transposase n=1 Tax=Mycobacterium xenopi 4042 TaxID=1299334 RepID=X8CMH4_MYCXE|nr:putative transposase [Mycobacterium xenopi 4042]